jgi:hypothetical protein
MPLHECRKVAVVSAGQQIAFPMTRNGSVFCFRRSFANGNGIDDPTRARERWRVESGACAASIAGSPSALFSIRPELE